MKRFLQYNSINSLSLSASLSPSNQRGIRASDRGCSFGESDVWSEAMIVLKSIGRARARARGMFS